MCASEVLRNVCVGCDKTLILWVWEKERGWVARNIGWYKILKELECHSKILLYDGKSLRIWTED